MLGVKSKMPLQAISRHVLSTFKAGLIRQPTAIIKPAMGDNKHVPMCLCKQEPFRFHTALNTALYRLAEIGKHMARAGLNHRTVNSELANKPHGTPKLLSAEGLQTRRLRPELISGRGKPLANTMATNGISGSCCEVVGICK
ncbi:hypothetical protein TNCV_1735701 [Trichonephila clavipes]|nr:hypothetical protein TNCV_1735701 [Trichonephila clavipes]